MLGRWKISNTASPRQHPHDYHRVIHLDCIPITAVQLTSADCVMAMLNEQMRRPAGQAISHSYELNFQQAIMQRLGIP